jgi:hypothetical protein
MLYKGASIARKVWKIESFFGLTPCPPLYSLRSHRGGTSEHIFSSDFKSTSESIQSFPLFLRERSSRAVKRVRENNATIFLMPFCSHGFSGA